MVIDFAQIPFQPKRAFLVFDTPENQIRGEHAHIMCKQFLVCVKGEIRVTLEYSFKNTETHLLKEGEGCFIDTLVWGKQEFITDDSILLVFASLEYQESDYIRDYEAFKKIVNRII